MAGWAGASVTIKFSNLCLPFQNEVSSLVILNSGEHKCQISMLLHCNY